MKVKVIKPFYDKVYGVSRKIGDAFAVSEERFKQINSTQFGELVVLVTEIKQKSRQRPRRG